MQDTIEKFDGDASSENQQAAALKQLSQWVCWREETRDDETTKVPIDPETTDYASSTDPETWGTYDKAVTRYQEDGSLDGVGFVFSQEDSFVGVDLDGCRDPESGDIEDWAEDIISRLDSYTEVSPSGTGFHIYLTGEKPEGRNRREQSSTLSLDKSPEVEVYADKRFFTFTGEHVDETPTVVEGRPAQLTAVYDDYIQEKEESTSETSVPSEADETGLADEEVIERAKNAKNGEKFTRLWDGDTSLWDGEDALYPSQSEADQALCTMLAYWTQCNDDQIDRLFRDSGLCRDKWTNRRDYRETTIQRAIAETDEVYRPSSSNQNQSTTIPNHVVTQLAENKGQYGYWDDDSWSAVTTFVVDVDAYLYDPWDDSIKIDATVIPSSSQEEPFNVVVEPTVFNDKRAFQDAFCTRRTTIFSGSSRDLDDLRRIVGEQDAPERVRVDTVGLHDGEFVTPTGVIGGDWAVDEPTHRYESTGSPIEEKWTIDIDAHDGTYDKETVRSILNLLPQTRDTERFYPVLGYVYATPLAPYIRKFSGELPFVMIHGDTGSGKTASMGYLTRLLGLDGEPHSADATKFTHIKTMSGSNAVPVWYDEYKPSDMAERSKDEFQERLRKVTRGADENRGNADQTVTTYTLEAPVIVSGEQEVQGAAEARRAIRTKFRTSVTEAGTDTRQAFHQLSGGSYTDDSEKIYCDGHDPVEHAVAYYQFVLGLDEASIRERWQQAKQSVHEMLAQSNIADITDLERTALSMIQLGLDLYGSFSKSLGMEDPLSEEEIEEALTYVASQMGTMNRTSHVDEFLTVVTQATNAGKLGRDEHFAVVRRAQSDEELRIKLAVTHADISKYVKDHDLSGVDLLNQPTDYKSRLRDMQDSDTYVVSTSKVTQELNRCVAIDSHRAEEEIDGFDRGAFVPTAVADENEE